jgi:peroxiredoxin
VAILAGRLNYKSLVFNLVLTVILIGTLGFNYRQEKLIREDIANTQGRPPAPGTIVPEFHLLDSTGSRVKFQDLHGQDTLLVLWYTGCHPSVQLLEALNALVIENNHVKIIPVNITDSLAETKAFYEQKGWDFPLYVDADKSTKWAFKASISPAFYLISSDGQIIYRQLGSSKRGFDYIANWLASSQNTYN